MNRFQMKANMYRCKLLAAGAICMLSAIPCWTTRPTVTSDVILAHEEGQVSLSVSAEGNVEKHRIVQTHTHTVHHNVHKDLTQTGSHSINGKSKTESKKSGDYVTLKVGTFNVLAVTKSEGPTGFPSSSTFSDDGTPGTKTKVKKNSWLKSQIESEAKFTDLHILALHEVDGKPAGSKNPEAYIDIDSICANSKFQPMFLPSNGAALAFTSGNLQDYTVLLWDNVAFTKPPECQKVQQVEVNEKDAMSEGGGWFFICNWAAADSLFKVAITVITGHGPSGKKMPDQLRESIASAVKAAQGASVPIVIAMGDFNDVGAEKGQFGMESGLGDSIGEDTKTTKANMFAPRKIAQMISNTKGFTGALSDSDAEGKDMNCAVLLEWIDNHQNIASGTAGSKEEKAVAKYGNNACKKEVLKIQEEVEAAIGLLKDDTSCTSDLALQAFSDQAQREALTMGEWYTHIGCGDNKCESLTDCGSKLISTKAEKKREDYIFANVAFIGGIWGADNVDETAPAPNPLWMSDHSLLYAHIPL